MAQEGNKGRKVELTEEDKTRLDRIEKALLIDKETMLPEFDEKKRAATPCDARLYGAYLRLGGESLQKTCDKVRAVYKIKNFENKQLLRTMERLDDLIAASGRGRKRVSGGGRKPLVTAEKAQEIQKKIVGLRQENKRYTVTDLRNDISDVAPAPDKKTVARCLNLKLMWFPFYSLM